MQYNRRDRVDKARQGVSSTAECNKRLLISAQNNKHITSFLHSKIANHSGYVQVDWKKVEKDVNKAKKHLKKKANKAAPEINTFIEEVKVPVTKLALCFPAFLPA